MKRTQLFPELEPPPGGLTALRARLDEDARSPRGWWVLAPAAVALAAGLVLLLSPTVATPDFGAAPGALSLGLAPVAGDGVLVSADVPMLALPSSNERVAMYFVVGAPAGSGAEELTPAE